MAMPVETGTTATVRPEERPTSAAEWVPLFNGKDLTGWKTNERDQWRVEKGAIVCGGPKTSYLFTERGDYADFHLRAEFKISNESNSGILFRCANTTGYEADISYFTDKMKLTSYTGSIFKGSKLVAPVREFLIRPDEWASIDVIAEGRRIRVLVNGKMTADYTDNDNAQMRGSIALQQFTPETVVHFRKIEIKGLNSSDLPLTSKPAHAADQVTVDHKQAVELN